VDKNSQVPAGSGLRQYTDSITISNIESKRTGATISSRFTLLILLQNRCTLVEDNCIVSGNSLVAGQKLSTCFIYCGIPVKKQNMNHREPYKMKKVFSKLLTPIRNIVRYGRLARAYYYDCRHYYRYSISRGRSEKLKLISLIMIDTHIIEKGLTMPESRSGFGQERLKTLIENINKYISLYRLGDDEVFHGISVVKEYFSFHVDMKDTIEEETYKSYKLLTHNQKVFDYAQEVERSEQILTSAEDYFQNSGSNFFLFSSSRRSIRNYAKIAMSDKQIMNALDLSRNTPSSCNRQAVRLHLYKNREKIADILSIQGGNRGFGHLAQCLIVVTYEPAMYFESRERYAGYVDGGMYCMNLLYALHHEKVSSCILNTSHTPEKDITIRKVLNIPESEVIVGMITCGVPTPDFKVAISKRNSLSHFLTEH